MENKYFNNKKLALSIFWIVLGIILIAVDMAGIVGSEILSGMGGGFIGVGALQVVRNLKYRNDTEYKTKIDIEANDERNQYLRMKAWSFAGYMFVIIAAVVSLVLMLIGRMEIGQTVSYCLCAELALFYISYIVLKKKY